MWRKGSLVTFDDFDTVGLGKFQQGGNFECHQAQGLFWPPLSEDTHFNCAKLCVNVDFKDENKLENINNYKFCLWPV